MSQEEIDELENKICIMVNERYNQYREIMSPHLIWDEKIFDARERLIDNFKDFILSIKFNNKKKKKKDYKEFKKILDNLKFGSDDMYGITNRMCGGQYIKNMNETQWKKKINLLKEIVYYIEQYKIKKGQEILNYMKSSSNNLNNQKTCHKCNNEITNDMYYCSKCGTRLRII